MTHETTTIASSLPNNIYIKELQIFQNAIQHQKDLFYVKSCFKTMFRTSGKCYDIGCRGQTLLYKHHLI